MVGCVQCGLLARMLRAECPNESCGESLLFRSSATRVQCDICDGPPVSVDRLRNVTEAKGLDEQLRMLVEKARADANAGKLGRGRARMANRMIDGVVTHVHSVLLGVYFSNYGVDDKNETKRLTELGRTEPFNVATLGDYAFAIRKEHLNVIGYGRDHKASRYLSNMIHDLETAKGMDKSECTLVPLQTQSSSVTNIVDAVSRCCTGREVFAARLSSAIIEHIRPRIEEYTKMTKYNQILSPIGKDGRATSVQLPADVELAALANVLRRAIVVLDGRPFYVNNVYLPLLCPSDHCCDQQGVKRSPLLLAWDDESYRSLVPVVSTVICTNRKTTIKPAWIPRDWLLASWSLKNRSVAETLLAMYLDFDEKNRCLVGQGKYFKPEHVQRIVTAFGEESLKKSGAHMRLVAEYMDEFDVGPKANIEMDMMKLCVDGQLWRCLRCDSLVQVDKTSNSCTKCSSKGSLRIQHVDGSVEYRDGDHTDTPAPNSWCFIKRKHFKNDTEYDNPPINLFVGMVIDGINMYEKVCWSCGESDARLNSRVETIADELIRKYSRFGVDAEEIRRNVKKQFEEKLSTDSIQKYQYDHLCEALKNVNMENFFDCSTGQQSAVDEDRGIDELLRNANEAAGNHAAQYAELSMAMGSEEESDWIVQQTKEINDTLELVEENVFTSLEMTLYNRDQDYRWRVICSRADLFQLGGLYFQHAIRCGYNSHQHFHLPLLGQLEFAFCDDEDYLRVCLPGGHFIVDESVELIRLMASHDPNVFSKIACDHKPADQ